MKTIPILLIQDTVFLLVVLVARGLLSRMARPRHMMLLWYAAAIRLALPVPLPAFFVPLSHFAAQRTYIPRETPTSSACQIVNAWLDSQPGRMALALWAAGACALVAYHLAAHLHWIRLHAGLAPVDDPDILELVNTVEHHPRYSVGARIRVVCDRLNIGRTPDGGRQPSRSDVQGCPAHTPTGIRVMWADDIDTPIAYGCVHPVILVPLQVSMLSTQQKQQVIEHEFVHIRKQDPLFKLVLTCICCFLWINPLVWVVRALACRDMELACDEYVTRFSSTAEKRSYAGLLLRFTSSNHPRSTPVRPAHPASMASATTATSTPSSHSTPVESTHLASRAETPAWDTCRSFPAGSARLSSGPATVLAMRIRTMKATAARLALPSLLGCLAAVCLAVALSTTGPASSRSPWIVQTEMGSITLPNAWHDKVEVSVVRTTYGTSFAMVYPIGQPEQLLIAFGQLESHLERTGDHAKLIAIASGNDCVSALWGFDYTDSVAKLPQWDASIPLVNAWQLSTGGNPDMDSLKFLRREVAPTFCTA